MNPISFPSHVLKSRGPSDHPSAVAAVVSPSATKASGRACRKLLRFLSAGFSCWALAAALMLPNTANAGIIVSEVAPWSSGNSSLGADWFELTNTGASAVNISGWKIDDNSFAFGSALALNGITSIAAGESVIFIELGSGHTAAGDAAAFKTLWFGASPPAGLQIGSYGGSGVGLSTAGDGVIIFNSSGVQQAKVSFGASSGSPYKTFDNAAGLDNTTISALSAVGTHGAFAAANDAAEIGSPGIIASTATPAITGAATATAFTTTYGTASNVQTFPVSGSNLTGNITATAPAGFEVSSDGSTYTTTAIFTQSGGSASGTLSLRLAGTATVTGSYNGLNVPLTSTGATTRNITTAASGNIVSAKGLTITASNVSKPFGTTLAGGPGSTAFSSSGLISPETIGSVTIAYGGGAAAGDAPGSYPASVTPSTATGGTFATSNYAITYVGGDLTVTEIPSIQLAGALSAEDTTYGTASPTPTSFSVTGSALTGDLTVSAPAGFELSSGGGYSSSVALTQSGGSVSSAINVRLAATTVVGTHSGNVSVSGGGADPQSIEIPSSTVSPMGLTIAGVTGVNKTYDRQTAATLSGTPTLNGVLTADAGKVTLDGTPSASFATFTVGTSKAITVTGYSLTGSAAANYTLAQPAAMTADITPLALTVSGAAVTSKAFDGNTNATITGTLVGVIAPDIVTFTGTGVFASSGVGAGITVTSTATLGGADAANYTLTQPAGLTGNIIGVDLSRYVRIGRYDLPEPTRTTAPANSLLCQEASNVTYNWDTDTLFITGDGGTSVVQVSKTGQLINSMTLPPGGSPQGTTFYDTEGLTYIGNGEFVMTEERDRQLVKFTYVPGGTLTRAAAKTVKLGTTIGNIGLEGVSWDPQTGGFICVKEKQPESIFQTNIDWNALTATNGSPTATGSTDLFNPALLNTLDFSDVFALSNLPALSGYPEYSHLLVISQESGQIVNCDRNGNVYSRLTIAADPGSVLTVPDMTMEGVTMDRNGYLYITNENGGGDANHPQLWVYAPSTATNLAPTALALQNSTNSIPENTSTAADVKLADIIITDDGLGVNNLTVSGADAASFNIVGTSLFLKAGTTLNATTKSTYAVTVSVDDTSVGNTPDASVNFTLAVTASTGGTPQIIISEVAPWSSGNSPVAADWFEVTNTGTAAQNITGWKMDDNSNAFGSGVALNGITSIAPGESVIFIETSNPAATIATFKNVWFGGNPPAGLQIGSYGGSGVGLSTAGDAVNLFDAAGAVKARVDFGASSASPFKTFDNAAGLNNVVLTNLAATGINGGFIAAGDAAEIGSPGTIGGTPTPIVSIVATDATAAEAGSDSGTFRISRSGSTTGSLTVNYTIAVGAGQADAADYTPALNGAAVIPSGQSFVDITTTPVDDTLVEGSETLTLTLFDTGSYDVGSPNNATVTIVDNDFPNQAPTAVTLNNAVTTITEITPITSDIKVGDIVVTDDGLGTNTLSLTGADAASFIITGSALYLKVGTTLNHATKPAYAVTVNVDDATIGGAPDASVAFSLTVLASPAPGTILISEVAPWSSSNSPVAVDWFEVTNTGTSAVDITGWKMDDNSNSITVAVPMTGVSSIAPGESVIFLETTDLPTKKAAFLNLWFGANPPASLQIGSYAGSGVGLSSAGDSVNLFDSSGNRITGISFGASPAGPFATFDNKVGLGSTTLPLPTVSALSAVGVNGGFVAVNDTNEIGSPGTISTPQPLLAWRQLHLGTVENNGNAADNADADGDGIPNLMEYALGTDPVVGSGGNGPTALPVSITNDGDPLLAGRLALSLTLPNPNPADISYVIQASGDLGTWTDVASKTGSGAWTWLAGGTPRIVISGGNPATVKIGDSVPTDAAHPCRLMRLKVTNP